MKVSLSKDFLLNEAINDEPKTLLENKAWNSVATLDHKTATALPTSDLLKIKRDNM